MAIGPNELKTAIIMCKRASCSGEESLAVAQTILALEKEYSELAQPATKEEAPKKDKPTSKQKRKPRGK